MSGLTALNALLVALGAMLGAPLRFYTDRVRVAAGVGFCALTTYSTFGHETIRLIEDGSGFYAITTVAANLIGGLGVALLGSVLGAAL
jgi:CrcB protein